MQRRFLRNRSLLLFMSSWNISNRHRDAVPEQLRVLCAGHIFYSDWSFRTMSPMSAWEISERRWLHRLLAVPGGNLSDGHRNPVAVQLHKLLWRYVCWRRGAVLHKLRRRQVHFSPRGARRVGVPVVRAWDIFCIESRAVLRCERCRSLCHLAVVHRAWARCMDWGGRD